MPKKIIAIWAEDQKGLIGREGHLPWYLPAELALFKQETMGQALLMGRKTFDSIKRRVLPGRVSLVLTRDRSAAFDGVITLHSREEVLTWCRDQERDLYVIGGSELFSLFSQDFDYLLRTVVAGEFEGGDTWFPTDFPWRDFVKTDESLVPKNGKNIYDFVREKYQKNV